ncbi:alpha/beta hydrolase [Hephaestia sp. GCM10023244]|uniref:alpha/beta hydrolase n=1 Tax=unclassified Hephaestia TaxID=2631281 RepID=UPI00207770AD|nr:alpha/beta hydrolase [Hephaestia sp. MAHUQ-44]MCM8731850.1 alpha/beta hydrolase [Hephaestia sp. MAHUQ-44]
MTPPGRARPVPASMTWDDLTRRPRSRADATIAYGDDRLQVVDVWRPAGAGPFRTVLMVHGGCWQTAIADRSLMDWVAADLRDAGYAVWNIDYRGVDRAGGAYPGIFLDAARAADALRDHAVPFAFDLRRIVAVGHSAGAHLALWLAARRNLPAGSVLAGGDPLRIDHVVALGGMPDLEAVAASPDNGCGTDVVADLVGAATDARPDRYADTSVPRLLPLGVPQDLINGREDRIVPFRFGTAYADQARAAGDPVALHEIAATGHVELIAPGSAAWATAKALIAGAFA